VSPDILIVGNRFLHDSSLVMVFGGTGFLQIVASPGLRSSLQRIWILPERTAVSIAVATTALALPVNIAFLADGWPTADFATAYLFHTNGGRVLVLQLLSAAALLGIWMYPLPRATVLVAGLMLCELALTGHASDGGTLHQVIAGTAEALHILAGAAWLGALPALLIVLHRLKKGTHQAECILALRNFSIIGHFVVMVTITFGISTALYINGVPHPSSEYSSAVLLKASLVLTMASLAVINRYAIVPRLRSHRCANSLLVGASFAEILLGMAALLLVAWFGLTDPA
jgi:copper resistance protein D